MKDGNYFYRDDAQSWWRATIVEANMARGGWISGTMPAYNRPGEWRGPIAEDDPEWQWAIQDYSGRLLPKWVHDKRNCLWTWESPKGMYVVSEWEDAIFFPDGTSRHDTELDVHEMKAACEAHCYL